MKVQLRETVLRSKGGKTSEVQGLRDVIAEPATAPSSPSPRASNTNRFLSYIGSYIGPGAFRGQHRSALAAFRRRSESTVRFLIERLRRLAIREDGELRSCVNLICIHYLGRPPSPEDLERYVAILRKGVPISRLVEDIQSSSDGHRYQLELEQEQRTLIELTYQQCLGRSADPDGLDHHIKLLNGGMSLSAVLTGLRATDEAKQYERARADERAFRIDALYRQYLGRPAPADVIQRYKDVLHSGLPFSSTLQEVATSPEAERRKSDAEEERAFFINAVYQQYLGRVAEPEEVRHWQQALASGLSFTALIGGVKNSIEANTFGRSGLLDHLSDGEFILAVTRLLGRGCTPAELEACRNAIRETPSKRIDFVRNSMASCLAEEHKKIHWDPYTCNIMGTGLFLTPSTWRKRAGQLSLTKLSPTSVKSLKDRGCFKHSGTYLVSAIASLYKGRRYLESFLNNIVSQSIFDRSELIIIDANSPEGEEDIIREYQQVYPNIVYKKLEYRISIYEAWNLGIQAARGRYLTNTNLDDLRRSDSFELQAAALDRHQFADVVYQPVFYSLDCAMNFDEVSRMGFKSHPPIITPSNLLECNWPHNGPMWRKVLHDELGLFDTSFMSASDWEFWLRCASKGKEFFKLNEPHVVYFQNPEGVSTRPDTKGVEEARRIRQRYCGKLFSPYFLMSRRALADTLGVDPNWDWNMSYFRVLHDQLRVLGTRYKEEASGA